ncbi:MAG: hypothetical protein LCH54_12995 [Bacteroidetes bacterium]|nr:hypothetical protein [Bacteroidota bacterium]
MTRQLFSIFLFLCGTVQVFAQNPAEWQFKIDKKDSLQVGDTLTFTAGWKGSSGYTWIFRMDSTTATVLEPLSGDTSIVVSGNETRYQLRLPFVFWGFQHDTLDPVSFVLENKTTGDSVWFNTPSLILNPKLFTTENDTLPRPEKDIFETGRPWWHYFLWILAGLLLAGVIYLIYRKVLKNRKSKNVSVEIVPVVEQSAWELFQLAMDDLLARQAIWPDDVKAFYSDLIEILKSYLERTTGSPVLEMTSDELLVWLNGKPGLKAVLPEMDELLNRADLIKFAKQNTVQSQMNLDFNSVRISVHKLETEKAPVQVTATNPDVKSESKGGSL